MLNLVIAIGRLGSQPELRYTPNGNAVCNFSVATNRTYTNGEGERTQQTEWIRVVTWNKLAETCNRYLGKGRLVAVVGQQQTRSWEGEDGVTRYRTEVVANTVKFLDGPSDSDAGPEEVERLSEGLAKVVEADVEIPF
jgi:single-strand DNA-binding protein